MFLFFIQNDKKHHSTPANKMDEKIRKRVVIDTNIFVEAYMKKKKGAARRIVQDGLALRVEVLYSDKIKEEVERIIAKFPDKSKARFELYQLFYQATHVIEPAKVQLSRDADDNMFIGCAIAGNAHYIVSYDIHLLELDGRVMQEHNYTIRAVRPKDIYCMHLI
jgi:putative PIN family toxin of toxin-antitoxin system